MSRYAIEEQQQVKRFAWLLTGAAFAPALSLAVFKLYLAKTNESKLPKKYIIVDINCKNLI